MARKSFIKDAETLYIDCTVFDQKTSCVSNAVGDLDFKTAAFDSEDIVCGTESMCLLADRWHGVADTTVSYKNFCVSSVFPTMGLIKTSIVDEDNNLSGNIQTNDISDADKQKGTVGPFREQLLIMGINLEAIKRYEDAAASNKEPSEADLEVINKILEGCFVIEQMGEKTCLAYDISYINYVLEELEKSGDKGVLYGILTNMKDNMPEDGIVTTFKGDFPEFSVTVEKLGPGYQALINADSSGFGKDLKNFRVAYTATDKSSLAYFLNEDGSYNWDNISEWLKSDPIDVTSMEYAEFAKLMLDMSDDDIKKILMLGQKCNLDEIPAPISYFTPKDYSEGEQIKILASVYALMATECREISETSDVKDQIAKDDLIRIQDQETRALAFLQAVVELDKLPGTKGEVDISTETDVLGRKIYTIKIDSIPNMNNKDPGAIFGEALTSDLYSHTITVHPRGTDSIDPNLDYHVSEYLESQIHFLTSGEMTSDDYDRIASQILTVLAEAGSDFGGEALSAVIGKTMFVLNFAQLAKDLCDDMKNGAAAEAAIEALRQGNTAICMCITGSVVYTSGGMSGGAHIANISFDEKKLTVLAAGYSIFAKRYVSPEELKEHFLSNDEEFQHYYDWYYSGEQARKQYEEFVEHALLQAGIGSLEVATEEEVQAAIYEANAAIFNNNNFDLGYLTDDDIREIEEYIDEHHGK